MPDARHSPRLSDPWDAAEHLRLVIDPAHLLVPTALVVGGNAAAAPVAHLHVVHCDIGSPPSECAAVLESALERLSRVRTGPLAGLAVGLTRPGGEQVQSYDRAWFRALHRVCHLRTLSAYGVYVVTRDGVRAVHLDDAA